ncbi:MAG: thymidylate synthase [Methanobacteriota archaeon]|nr:MAG: thymidylate synthase [Euryarchaeota archaeon]
MKTERFEPSYLALAQRIVDEGEWIENKRTGKRCKTVIGHRYVIDCSTDFAPVVTTRKMGIRTGTAEIIGYLRGVSNAREFDRIGTKSWYANANMTKAWLANPNRKGEDDCGRIYGVQGRDWRRPDGTSFDQLAKIVNDLSNGIDDRGEILMFYNPGEINLGCLRPCMYEHVFSLVGDKLYLHSTQRSYDWAIGGAVNTYQVWLLLKLMARITGKKPAVAVHTIINCHIYEDQFDDVLTQLERKNDVYPEPRVLIDERIQSLHDIDSWVTADHFRMEGYQSHPAIKYKFSE